MKKKLVVFTFLITSVIIHGQPTVKIFAFEQQSHPGTVPAAVKDENGNPIQKAAAKTNYFIFLSFKKNYVIKPVQIFIKGFSFAMDTVTEVEKTPVEYTNRTIPDNPHKTTLVPKTSNKVIKIDPTESVEPVENGAHIKNLIKANDVVITYVWKGKEYFVTEKKIKELDPIFHE
jgi:hypothetical protein